MVNIAQITKKRVNENIMLENYLARGLINYVALAEKLKPEIEKELNKKVKVSTIAMALRRFSEKAKKVEESKLSLKGSELIMKSNLCDITVYKSPNLFSKLKKLYEVIDYNKGDTLNIIHGNYDVSIIINERFEKKLREILEEEKILHIERELVAVTVKFGEHFLYTPGITFSLLKQLVLNNVNLIEIVSSLIEVTFIINKKEGIRAYNALEGFIERK